MSDRKTVQEAFHDVVVALDDLFVEVAKALHLYELVDWLSSIVNRKSGN